MFVVKDNMVMNIFGFLIISFGEVSSSMLLGEKLWASLELLNPISKMLLLKVCMSAAFMMVSFNC